jgi:hypothetical protein
MSGLSQEREMIRKRTLETHFENEAFRKHLYVSYPAFRLDQMFRAAYSEISPKIDCTLCAACCKELQPEIAADEFSRLSETSPPEHFISVKDNNGAYRYYMNNPCCFLENNLCSIYTSRPAACSSYPHLDLPGIRFRLRTVFEQGGKCPIVYHVIESLKSETGFRKPE